MVDNFIIYEQPLNELVRACLRLERLFQQIDHQITDTSSLGTHYIVTAIIDLLTLVDRPDLKAKLTKELSHHITILSRLEKNPEIDEKKLRALLDQLNELSHWFINSSGKIGQNLHSIELLNNLRLHLNSPGGGSSFDTPVYYYWLQLPIKKRQAILEKWLKEFDSIRLAVKLILQLIREEAKVYPKTAEKGFYQELLDPQINLRLVRVAISNTLAVCPEISVSRHFVGVRFLTPHVEERPTQCIENVPFLLSYCSS